MGNTAIKVDIISGFLGAGKTTLIQKLLREALQGEKVVLIENEFGEIAIDGGFLKDTGIEIREMSSGCICCSLAGDFTAALQETAEQFSPDRIIIEPSGVGKLSDVSKAVENAAEGTSLSLHSMTTVVDAKKIDRYSRYIAEFYNDQVGNASAVILSRTQNLTEKELAHAVEVLRGINRTAAMITTPWEELTGVQMLEAMENTDTLKEMLMKQMKEASEKENEEECSEEDHDHGEEHHHGQDEHGHHHHHADDIFTAWGKETPRSYTKEEVEQILKKFDQGDAFGTVLRAKGILPSADGTWINFDYVPGECDIRTGAADYTGRICVIGEQLDDQKLEELFSA